MFKRGLLAVALAAFLQPSIAAACGGGDQVVEHVVVTPRPYSPAMATAVIGELAGCQAGKSCEALAQLRDYGTRAVPQLLAALKAGPANESTILDLIERAKPASAGHQLVRIANDLPRSRDLRAMYTLASRLDPDVLGALIAQFQRVIDEPDASRRHAVAQGLRSLGDQTVAWAAKELPCTTNPLAIAELVRAVATSASAATVAGMIGVTNDPRANHRFASIAISSRLGDDRPFDVLYDGLTHTDAAIRADALDHFSAGAVPAHQRWRFASIFEAELATRPLDLGRARTLITLGSANRSAFELVFGDLTASAENTRIRGVQAVIRHVSHVAPSLRSELAARIEKSLAMPLRYERLKTRLEAALKQLQTA